MFRNAMGKGVRLGAGTAMASPADLSSAISPAPIALCQPLLARQLSPRVHPIYVAHTVPFGRSLGSSTWKFLSKPNSNHILPEVAPFPLTETHSLP